MFEDEVRYAAGFGMDSCGVEDELSRLASRLGCGINDEGLGKSCGGRVEEGGTGTAWVIDFRGVVGLGCCKCTWPGKGVWSSGSMAERRGERLCRCCVGPLVVLIIE